MKDITYKNSDGEEIAAAGLHCYQFVGVRLMITSLINRKKREPGR